MQVLRLRITVRYYGYVCARFSFTGDTLAVSCVLRCCVLESVLVLVMKREGTFDVLVW